MAGDIIALMDHLEIERADIMGYSLGGRMTAWLGAERSRSGCARRSSAASALRMIEGGGPGENVAAGAGGAIAG